jgi:hypothetical protein
VILALRRLRLQPGDIVIVENVETARRLMQAARLIDLPKGVDNVPIVIAPEGVKKLPVEKLKQIVSQMESKVTAP